MKTKMIAALTVVAFATIALVSTLGVAEEQHSCKDVSFSSSETVCGWYNPSVQCFAYPCAQTYPDSASACNDRTVSYYTLGACEAGYPEE